MDLYTHINEMMDAHEKNMAKKPPEKKPPRPGFSKILNARKEQLRAQDSRRQPAPDGGIEPPSQTDFSMFKLYLSILQRKGAHAPAVSPGSPDASNILLESLKAYNFGSRRLFFRDSDTGSSPRFPAVRHMGI